MQDKNKKPLINKEIGFNLFEVIVIIVVTGVMASLCSGIVVYNSIKPSTKFNYQEFNSDKNLQKFVASYVSLIENYYETVDKEKIINSAINAMFAELGDPYTTYMSEEETKALNEVLSGQYHGIGIRMMKNENNELIVVEVFKNTSAEKSGILVNDIFTKIDGHDVSELNVNQAAALVKDNQTKSATIEVLRNGEILTVVVDKSDVYIPSIVSEVIENEGKNVGYLQVQIFSETTAAQIKDALKDLENKNISSLIIDVRNNSGGYLNSATDIASLFLEKGKIIYSLQDKNKKNTYKSETNDKTTYPIVVLINGGSASASEILAAALKQSYGATLVGEKTFGKGKVQQTVNLKDGAMVKYTSAKWLTPDGTCIDGVGIEPDHAISNIAEDQTDYQILKALELLK